MILEIKSEFANVWVIVTFLTVSLLFALITAIYLHRRRKRHAYAYPELRIEFGKALKDDDIGAIIEIGDRLIWNEDFSQEDRKYVYEQLNSRIKKYPELKQTWEYAHFKRFGAYPEE